jgi:hypothetical protein
MYLDNDTSGLYSIETCDVRNWIGVLVCWLRSAVLCLFLFSGEGGGEGGMLLFFWYNEMMM